MGDFSGGKLGKCKTTPCSDCAGFTTPNPFFSLLDKTYRKRRLMERLQGSKPASHGRRLCAHTAWWAGGGDCQKCEDQWLKKHDLKVSTYTPPSFFQNIKNQVLFQVDFTWNTRLSNAELYRMIAKTDGLATYACDTILHNVCDLTGTETDDVKDLFIGLKTGNMRMAIENICDICVDKAQDITGIEARTCINLLKNVCLRRWKAARQDINKIGTDVVCRQCNIKQDELKEFIADPTAVTAVNICAGIMKTQIERVCPIIRCLPAFNIEFRRRLISEGSRRRMYSFDSSRRINPLKEGSNLNPWFIKVQGAGSAQMNGSYYRREALEGPPECFKIPEGKLASFRHVLEGMGTIFKDFQKYFDPVKKTADATANLVLKLSGSRHNLTAGDKERERKRLQIWQIFTDGRQWYEKKDGSYIFWSASCEYETPNEFVGKSCTIGKAEWRLSDKLGNVHYTVKGNDSVTCAGKADCGVLPP